jgi:hypothetical protein
LPVFSCFALACSLSHLPDGAELACPGISLEFEQDGYLDATGLDPRGLKVKPK